MKRPYRSVLENAVRKHVPDHLDLFPRISAQLERRGRLQPLRVRPAIVVMAAAVLALGLLSGAVYVVGRSLGYIPGVGIVEQTAGLRVLAEPVAVEREGIILTVTQALASSDRTVINYQVENIPETALARDPREGETPDPRCYPTESLRLPDGTILSPTGGQGGGWGLGFHSRVVFDPLPANVNEVTLVVPCLPDTSPGMAPDNWQVPLVFVPAPPDLTVVPVVEITPSLPPAPETSTESATAASSPITLERTIELDDGYILIGSFHSISTAGGLVTSPYAWSVRITDSEGREVPSNYADDIDLPGGDEQTSPWAYKILGKAHAWPLTLTVDELEATLPDAQDSFEFETGPSPQPDQHWALNQDLHIGGYTVRVVEVIRTPVGYSFSFRADPEVISVGVDIRGPDEYIAPAGGGGGGNGNGAFSAGVAYAGRIPEGKLTVVVANLTIRVPGPWSILWEPESAVRQPASSPSLGSTPCVTDEVWAQVKASVAPGIPSGLPGRFFIVGPSADGSAYGVLALDLASQGRQFLAEGSWPIVSPDGKKVVYTAEGGLEVHDLDSGEGYLLPGTDATDYRMVWSPDGTRIAFIRSSTNRIMRINADGTDQQQVRDNSAVYHLLVGWADSTHLLITEPGPDGVYFQSLDLEDGSSQNLFAMSSNKADAVVSSDGQWIAFTNSLGGMSGNGLYISHLDGSGRRMVAALNGRALYFPIWSPDDRWLILSLPDPDDPVDQAAQALVEVTSCRVIPLPDLGGEVYSWGK